MEQSTWRKSMAILGIVGYAVVIVLNTLATTLPLGGMNTGKISDLYPNLFVPAGLTFSIWGVIYLLMAIFVVYCVVRAWRQGPDVLERVAPLFLLSCAANSGWILAWQYRVVWLSLVIMVILLLTLIFIYQRLEVGRSSAGALERYLVHLLFSIYLGWITIATIANVTALLVYYRWNGFGASDQLWAVIMIAVGIAMGLIMAFTRGDIFYALVVDWALLGIYLKRSAAAQPAQSVVIAAIVGLVAVSAAIIVQLARRRVYRVA